MKEFLGDKPIKAIIKLILLSLFVGFILKILHITPVGLFEWFIETIADVITVSFDNVEKVISYILTGAIVVIPLWIFKRWGEKNREQKIKNAFKDKP